MVYETVQGNTVLFVYWYIFSKDGETTAVQVYPQGTKKLYGTVLYVFLDHNTPRVENEIPGIQGIQEIIAWYTAQDI